MRKGHELAIVCYVLLGTALLVIGGIGVFGGMFSSIPFAAAALVLVVLPAAIALVLMMTRSASSPLLMLVSCFTVICFVCAVFVRDLRFGAPPTAFVHEPAGWIAVAVAVSQLPVSSGSLCSNTAVGIEMPRSLPLHWSTRCQH